MNALAPIAFQPSDTADWYTVAWSDVWARLKIEPTTLPGVRSLPQGRSKRRPFLHEIHRTHLPALGLVAPAAPRLVLDAPILRPHQVEAVNFIRSRRGTLLADEMRVGKSAAIMYAHEPEHGPLLMLGPLAAKAVWHEWAVRRFGTKCVDARMFEDMELRKKCPVCERLGVVDDRRKPPSFMALVGRSYKPEEVKAWQPSVMFATFAVASTWRQLFADVESLGTLGTDEAHLAGVQNRNNLTVESISWLNAIAHRVVVATGTPLFNRVKGLWPLLSWAAPAAFGDFWSFAGRYCAARPGAHGWSAEGASNEVELKKRLTEVMLRRRWIDIASNLPPITRSQEIVALPAKVKDAVEEIAARIRYEKGGAKTLVGDLARMRKMFAKEKVPAAVELTARTLADGYSCIVWAWHTEVAETLVQKLSGLGLRVHGPITGKTSGSSRDTILEAARSDTGARVLVANIAALGTAVNLNWASHEVFSELDWSPPNIAQAEMRPYDGQHPISVVYLVADVDADERLANALLHKLETQQALGLSAGAGDVRDVLQATFGIGSGQTLDELASRLIGNAEGEC